LGKKDEKRKSKGSRLSGLELPKELADFNLIKSPRCNSLYIHAEKVVIKDKEVEMTINWQQLKDFKRITFVVGDEKLTFERRENG